MRMWALTAALTVLVRIKLVYGGYLRGKHLRIGYFETQPDIFTEYDRSTNSTILRGVFYSLLQWMAARENFTYHQYTLLLIDYTNGFNGLPQEFQNKSLQVVLNNLAVRFGRTHLARFLHPYTQGEHIIIIPFPKNQANLWSILWPYKWAVWLCLCLTAVAMIFFLSCMTRMQRSISHSSQSKTFVTLSEASAYVVGIITNQGNECGWKTLAVRLLAGTWCMAAVVLVNAFSSSLITYLTVPTITPLVNTLRDLANRSEPQILTRPESYLRSQFESSPAYAQYRDNVIKFPRDFCGQLNDAKMEACLSLVKKGGYVLAMEGVTSKIMLHNDFRKTKRCDLTFAEESYEKGFGASVIPVNSPHQLRNSLDTLIMHANSLGLMDKWRSEYIPRKSMCIKYRRLKDDGLRQLTIKDLGTAFVVLLLGIGLGAIAFLFKRFM